MTYTILPMYKILTWPKYERLPMRMNFESTYVQSLTSKHTYRIKHTHTTIDSHTHTYTYQLKNTISLIPNYNPLFSAPDIRYKCFNNEKCTRNHESLKTHPWFNIPLHYFHWKVARLQSLFKKSHITDPKFAFTHV